MQEAKFEIISSEASYLKSLNVLVAHFANSPKLRHNHQVISKHDWDAIFSNVYQVMLQLEMIKLQMLTLYLSLSADPGVFREVPPGPGDLLAAEHHHGGTQSDTAQSVHLGL